MNRAIALASAGIALVTSVTAYSIYRESQIQREQIADYDKQLQQLLGHLENNTRQRLDFENQIEQLKSELLRSSNRVKTLDSTLVETQQKINPDYAKVEQDIRRRVNEEIRRQYEHEEAPSAASLISQMAQMSQEDRMAIMQVQGQYSNFLNALNTTGERKEQITQALIDVTLGQNQARTDLMSQGLQPRELRSQITDIMSPDYTRDALSYELTDAELALFDENQQQNQTQVFAAFSSDNGALRIRGGGPGGPGGPRGAGLPPGAGAGFDIVSDVIVGPDLNGEPGQGVIIRQLQAIPAAPQ